MNWEQLFGLAGDLALAAWVALICLPRNPSIVQLIRYGVVGVLAALYASLVFAYFFRVRGGGFGSLAAVRALFGSDPVLLAGWVHYLAFDIFTGVWIAERLDGLGTSRWLQAPILIATFLFGPLGLLLCFAVGAVGSRTSRGIRERS
jgi:hypothetical protein